MSAETKTPPPARMSKAVNPCICGHEKADHQARIGRGNYRPCCIGACDCSGFRTTLPRGESGAFRFLSAYVIELERELAMLRERAKASEATR